MISPEEVVYAYRLLLGREPENTDVVNHYATELQSLKALRELFLNSPEFREKLANHLTPRAPRPSLVGAAMDVDVAVSEADMAALFAQTAQQWQHLGEIEPHWSVITNDNYLRKNFDGKAQAFYASGESECKAFDATLKRVGVITDPAWTCLEFGCGVGRVTAALAKRFALVVGVDISLSHLQHADHYNTANAISNVRLQHLQNLEELSLLGAYDVLYSRIVLQHNPPPVQAWLLQRLLGQLRKGGVGFFQIPVYKAGYRFRIQQYLSQPNHTDMEMHYLPQTLLLRLVQESGCRVLELREDDSIGLSATALSNTVLVQKD